MRHRIKKVSKEVEVLELNSKEYQNINDFYKESLLEDGLPYPVVRNCNLNKLILTNGMYRKELTIEINDSNNFSREEDAKERRKYLEELESNMTDMDKEYSERMKSNNYNPLEDKLNKT